jgi:flagellar protein FliO/FliZ
MMQTLHGGHRILRKTLRAVVARGKSLAVILTGLGWMVPATLYASAAAQSTSVPAVRAASALPDQGSYMLQVLLGLVFVLALVFASAWLLRRVSQGSFSASNHMQVLAALPMGTRERLVLVEVGGQQLLLGITATTINTLHAFDKPVITATEKASPSDFASKIREVMAKGMVKPK